MSASVASIWRRIDPKASTNLAIIHHRGQPSKRRNLKQTVGGRGV